MFRNLTRYFIPLILCVPAMILSGCEDSNDIHGDQFDKTKGMVTITLRNGEDYTRVNDDSNNESLLSNVLVALYPSTAGDDAVPVAYEVFTELNTTKTTTVQMQISEEMRDGLFNGVSGSSCRMYVVCNLTNPESVPANPSVNTLKNLQVSSTFDSKKVQDSFVMAGEGSVTYSVNGKDESASGITIVYRAAAKIRLNISIPESVEQDGETWIPQAASGGMTVLLDNGVKDCVAAPGMNWKPSNEESYFKITTRNTGAVRTLTNTGTSEYPYSIDTPLYTYPNEWENSPSEMHQTFMTLIVPWRKQGSQEYLSFYYQVPVNQLFSIAQNYSYTVNLNVGMLGSLQPESPVEVEDLSYQVIEWGKEDIDVNMRDTRYLVVSPNIYTANNEEEITIPFYTSHTVEIVDESITYDRFNFYDDNQGTVVHFTINETQIGNSNTATDTLCSVTARRDEINNQLFVRVYHPLKIWIPYNSNNQEVNLTKNATNTDLNTVKESITRYVPSDENSYSCDTIKFTIRHLDDATYSENVTVVQRPAIYIVPMRNPGNGSSRAGGNVFVNNYPGIYSNSTNDLGSVADELGTGDNSNPNMYIINVSSFDEGTEYNIGDPRTDYYNNNLSSATTSGNPTSYPDMAIPTSNGTVAGNWCRTAGALYPNTSSRRLTYYYPTIESQDIQYKMRIAPKFRVASSYGKTTAVNRDAARRRMATYQELNCPAGRWRLPTYGELQFIISLSSTKKIPVLFAIGSNYWTAQGQCTVNSDGTITLSDNTNSTCFVRGVYDEWFWEEKSDYVITPNGNNYTYTLGDMPKNP